MNRTINKQKYGIPSFANENVTACNIQVHEVKLNHIPQGGK